MVPGKLTIKSSITFNKEIRICLTDQAAATANFIYIWYFSYGYTNILCHNTCCVTELNKKGGHSLQNCDTCTEL